MARRKIMAMVMAAGLAGPAMPDTARAGGDAPSGPSATRQARGFGFYGDQRGCYWAEGRRYCARYCYWEVDGVRYCQTRERLAVPQGDPWFRPYPPEPPIYPPYRRLR